MAVYLMKEGWKFVLMECGGSFVMMGGGGRRLELCAGNWDMLTPMTLSHSLGLTLVLGITLSTLTT